jgi:hypothetical protein
MVISGFLKESILPIRWSNQRFWKCKETCVLQQLSVISWLSLKLQDIVEGILIGIFENVPSILFHVFPPIR